jgi:hypothetical protein
MQTQPGRPFTQFSPSAYGITPAPGGGGGGAGANGCTSAVPVAAPRTIYSLQHAGFRYDFSYPKPKAPGQSGGGAGAGGSGSSGGGGGKKGKGSSQSSSSGQSGAQGGGQGGGGQSQAQSFNSYLEFGFERGTLYHGVSAFNFQGVSCGVVDFACLGGLTSSNSTLQSVSANRTHQQRGFYFNFRFDAPMPMLPSSEMVFENKGTWMPPHSDILLDTRLNDDFKVSLVVPLWQKLSLSPSLEMIFFQNQVRANLYHSYTTSLSLNYSFEWHNGIWWKRAAAYSNPVPTQPTLPTK